MVPMPASTDLLIAPPQIPDKRFRGTVLMMTHDHQGGTFALCLNQPTDHTLLDILEDTGIEANLNFPLYWGGPVNPGSVWMLHSTDWSIESTVNINDDWAMTSNEEMFHHLADGDCPRFFRMMFGYCSWAPGQLKAELRGAAPWNKNHSWLIAENPGPEWIMEYPVDELWAASAELCSHQAVDSWL